MTETEIHRMIVRLVGDGASYQQMLDMAQTSTQEAAKKIEQASTRMQKVSSVLNEVGGRLRMAGFRAQRTGTLISLAITTPLSLIGNQARSAATEFESALSRMEGLVGIARDEVQGFRQDILNLGYTGKGPLELAKAMEFITSAGLRGNTALETLTITAKAGAAGLGEVVTIANAVTSALNAYGPEVLSATKATDILVAAVREGKAEAASYAPVFGQVLPLAQEMGVTFGETAGIIAFLTRTTGNAAIATTQLRSLMSQLNNSEMDKKLKKVGISAEELLASIKQKGLLAALIDLKKRGDATGVPLKEMIKDIEGLMGALQLTGSQSGIAIEMIRKVNGAAGDTEKAFEAAKNTVKHGWNVALADMQAEMIKIGDLLTPITGQFLNLTQFGLSLWKGLSDETKRLVVVLAAVAASIGPILVGFGTVVTMAGFMITAITSLITVVTMYGGVILTVAGATAALVAGVVALGVVVVNAFGGVSNLMNTISAAGEYMYNLLIPIVMEVGAIFSAVWEGISAGATALFSTLNTGFGMVYENLKGGLMTGVLLLRDYFLEALIGVEFFFRNFGVYLAIARLKYDLWTEGMRQDSRHFFTVEIPTYLLWFANNWRDILTDLFNFTTTVFFNIGKNIVDVFMNLPALIAGTVDLADIWTPLTEGFEAKIKELPKIADRQKSVVETALEKVIGVTENGLDQAWDQFRKKRKAELVSKEDAKAATEKAGEAAASVAAKTGAEIGKSMKKGIEQAKPLQGVARGSAQALADIMAYMATQNKSKKPDQKAAPRKMSKMEKQSAKDFRKREKEQAMWDAFGVAPSNPNLQTAYDQAMYDAFGYVNPTSTAARAVTDTSAAVATRSAASNGFSSPTLSGQPSATQNAAMVARENPAAIAGKSKDNEHLKKVADGIKKLVEMEEKKAGDTLELAFANFGSA